jgi:Na+/H+ antiporter NhaC
MKRILALFILTFITATSYAQCAICTKTASQMGEEAGKGFNAGVLYLAAMPFAIVGFIAYRFRKNEKLDQAS